MNFYPRFFRSLLFVLLLIPLSSLLQELPYQPQMPKRIQHRALEHPPDRPRPLRLVLVLPHGTVLSRSCCQRFSMDRHRIVYKQLNPHRGESR